MRCSLFCLAVSLPLASFAQQDSNGPRSADPLHNSFSISYGAATPDYLLDGYRPGRPTEYDYANKGTPGAVCIAYKYLVSRHASVGITATIEQQHGDWLDNEIPGGNVFDLQTTVKGAFIRTCYTMAAEFSSDYVHRDLYRFYTVAGLGFTEEIETDQYDPGFYNKGYNNGVNVYGPMRTQNNHTHINACYSPLGMSIGKKLSYFLELGFGYKGIVNTGLSYKF